MLDAPDWEARAEPSALTEDTEKSSVCRLRRLGQAVVGLRCA